MYELTDMHRQKRKKFPTPRVGQTVFVHTELIYSNQKYRLLRVTEVVFKAYKKEMLIRNVN